MLPRKSSLWHRWCWWKVSFIYFHIPRDLGQTLAEGESEKIICVCVHMWIFQKTSYHLKKILWDFSCFLSKARIPWTSLSVLSLYPIDFLRLFVLRYSLISLLTLFIFCSSMLFSLYVIVLFLFFPGIWKDSWRCLSYRMMIVNFSSIHPSLHF